MLAQLEARGVREDDHKPDSYRDAVAEIKAAWSAEERKRRAELGRIRREQLLATLGLTDRVACA